MHFLSGNKVVKLIYITFSFILCFMCYLNIFSRVFNPLFTAQAAYLQKRAAKKSVLMLIGALYGFN